MPSLNLCLLCACSAPCYAPPSRCDVRNATRTVAVVAVIDWLLALRERTRARANSTSTSSDDSPAARSRPPLEGVNDAGNDIVNEDANASSSTAVRDTSGVSAGETEEKKEEAEGEGGSVGGAAGEESSEAGGKSGSGEKGKRAGESAEERVMDSLPRDLLLVTGTAKKPVSEYTKKQAIMGVPVPSRGPHLHVSVALKGRTRST